MRVYLNYIIIGVAALLAGRYILQPRQQVKEVIKVVEVERRVKEERKKTRTETKEIIKPDGSKETTTVVTEDLSSKETGSRETIAKKSTETKKGGGITLGVLALKDLDRFSNKTEIGMLVSVPLFSRISLIGSVDTTKRIGMGFSLEF
jgi:hypothetical protein